jgi:pantoate--beta-alanine ligase
VTLEKPKVMSKLRVVRSLPALRHLILDWNRQDASIALVPTMGALHAGHIALVRTAKRRAQRVVVSIFVNPAQFGPQEDFASYPRRFDDDIALLRNLAIDAVWAPSATAMYPLGFSTRIVPQGPANAGLEDKFRPHFFTGVATVVGKLLIQCMPDFATFGEKDYQQLKVVSRMVKDLNLATRIIPVPTVREKDGLAMSSRNAHLTPDERSSAPTLYRVLKQSAVSIARGEAPARVLKKGAAAIDRAGFVLDYLEARDAETLEPVTNRRPQSMRLLVAARIGRTRLIDNIAVDPIS